MPGIIVVGTQWGDEGKGKATDQLGTGVDVVVKFNGGNNAGHTVVVDGQSYALHLLPAGILNPQATPVIGNGVVVDLQALFAEIDLMESRGVDCSKLLVSANAHVIPSYNRIFDRATEEHLGKRQIGTTGRGIGPTYADKMNRIGVRIQDVLNEDVLRQRVKGALLSKNELMSSVYGMEEIDPDAVVQELLAYQERLRPMVVDTSLFVNQAMDANQIVLFEAGQAAMLDIDHGTYPYVTSSNAIAGGALTGTGVGPTRINSVVGVTKAYTTRVGEGPFPSELFGEQAEHLRVLGGEYGVTTGRSRRVGWFDPLVVRYAARVNSLTDVVLTKLDVLDTYAEIPVCVGYEIDGVVVTEMPVTQVEFAAAKPILKVMPGWNEDISAIRRYQDLPVAAREYVEFLEELIGCRISSVGVGQAREAIIIRHELGR